MKLKHLKNTILAALTILLVSTPATSQTPNASHSSRQLPAQHKSMADAALADMQPVAPEIRAAAAARTQADVARRESLDAIYNQYWDSPSVNPYGSAVSIPAVKDIDVSEGVVPVRSNVSSKYGWRPQFGRMHRGVDLSLRVGDTVRTAFTGKVRLCKFEGKGYGNYVVVRHDNGMETVYGHLSRFLVKPGQTVKAGQPIALGGNTGRSTGPHLHFETRYLGLPVNPEWIFDFEHRTTIKDTYTFDKSLYDRAQVSGSRKKAASTSTASKSKTKSKASSRTSRRRARK